MTYKIKLANGIELTNLTMNGNNFVSKTEVDTSIFTEEALEQFIVSSVEEGKDEHVEIYDRTKFIQQQVRNDGYYLVFYHMTPREIQLENIQKAIHKSDADVTDIQVALAEIYEIIVNGG